MRSPALIASCGRAFRHRRRLGAGQGHARPQAAAAARQPRRSQNPGQGSVRPRDDADRGADPLDRLLFPRLPCRGEGAAGRRRDLAGDAAFAQPLLGPSRDDRLSRAVLEEGRRRGRLARHSRRRHFAAARRPDADRTRLASDRPRRRHLADADARASADRATARKCRRSTWWPGRALGRQVALVGAAGGDHQSGGGGAGSR